MGSKKIFHATVQDMPESFIFAREPCSAAESTSDFVVVVLVVLES